MSRKKKAVFALLSLMVGTIIAFAILEVALRLFLANRFENVETLHMVVPSDIPGLGYVLASNHDGGNVRTNEDGLRIRTAGGSQTQYTILVLGDSVVFGGAVPYEQNLTALLESELDSPEYSIAVWNSAAPGYNTSQESILLRTLAPKVRPDLVLIGFCMNDYLPPPTLTPAGQLDVRRLDVTRFAMDDKRFSLRGVLYRSRAIVFLKEKLKDLQKLRPGLFPRSLHYISYVHQDSGWARAQQALLEIRDTAREIRAEVLLVLFPVEQQLRIPERSPQDNMIAFAQREGIATIDLYEPFQQNWQDGLFFDYSIVFENVDKLHLNHRGHALAAQEIARFIQTNMELLPLGRPVRKPAP